MESQLDTILHGLNTNQEKAVTFGRTPLLLLAGAGSGKTRVLTHRIAYLIAQGIPAYNFLAVTFTNKAAQEMRERIHALVNEHIWVSTFHSSCLRILKMESEYAGLAGQFSVYDDADQLVLIKECLKELRLDEKQFTPKTIRERISRAKDALISVEQFEAEGITYYDEAVSKVYRLYEKKLGLYNAIDFGGLISKCIELFKKYPVILSKYQKRFECVLIDEYQDTNRAQYQWVKMLAHHHKNLTVVGDPDQSIYGWRGADIMNILTFEEDYPNATVIKLDKNYRSTKTILDAANALIAHNVSRKEKELWTDNAQGEPLSVYEARDERDEAHFVASHIDGARSLGESLNDIVIFYRTHAQSRVLEDALRRLSIPYKIVGGLRFYDRKEIKDMLAYLKVIATPQDEISLRRIINVPTRGIGQKALETISRYQYVNGVALYTALSQIRAIEGISVRARKSIACFFEMIESFRLRKADMMPSQLVRDLLHESGYLSYLEADLTVEGRARLENIKEFLGGISEFEENATAPEHGDLLDAYLDMISLQSNVDDWAHDEGTLSLMTIHTAKGLEFDTVFMIGMEENVFPHSNVLQNAERELEEERRLCYVAITRAKKEVLLTHAESRRLYGNKSYNMPSRFLRELPRRLVSSVRKFEAEETYVEPFDCIDIEYEDIF